MSTTNEDRPEFFTAGGSLRYDAPSYVPRPADELLQRLLLEGQLCYVLTTRQMGKSSLMIRTARFLQGHGARTAIVDLTGIGTATLEEWLLSILDEVHAQLDLDIDLEAWWDEQDRLSHIRRFTKFVQECLPAEVQAPVIIFIDEVDSALHLPFSDDFFSALRAIYQHGTTKDAGQPVSFVLLGVATPNDLIKDASRTPFNIGIRIPLSDLELMEAEKVMAQGFPEGGEEILRRIFHWTGGHPYLTQRVGLEISKTGKTEWTPDEIDALVEHLFLTRQAQAADSNLQFVGDRVLASPRKTELLKLYKQLLAGRTIVSDGRSLLHNELRLYGLAGVDDQGCLQVRNLIYRRIFDEAWIRANMPTNQWRNAAILASAVAVLAIATLFAYLMLRNPPEEVRAETYVENFTNTSSPSVRISNLAGLLGLEGSEYRDTARMLFSELSSAEQSALFDANLGLELEQQIVISGTYTTLAVDRFTTATTSNQLLRTMSAILEGATEVPGEAIQSEISVWLDGREKALAGDYAAALALYESALRLNENNPSLRFEKAIVRFILEDYVSAIAELEGLSRLGPLWEKRARTLLQADSRWREESESARNARLLELLTPTPTPRPVTETAEDRSVLQGLLSLLFPALADQRLSSPAVLTQTILPALATAPRATPTIDATAVAQLATEAVLLSSMDSRVLATSQSAMETAFAQMPTEIPLTVVASEVRATSTATQTSTVMPTPTVVPPAPQVISLELAPSEFGFRPRAQELVVFQIGNGPRKVIVVGGIHAGLAPASVSVADRLLTHVQEHPEWLPEDITLFVLPNANPDSVDAPGQIEGRLNANGVDLNRNWGCNWSPEATTQGVPLNPGAAPYSEPETVALSDFLLDIRPDAVVVYGARATGGLVSPGACTERHENSEAYAFLYSEASRYDIMSADFTEGITGDITNTLTSENIAAIFVLLTEYDTLSDEEFTSNLAGLLAVMNSLR